MVDSQTNSLRGAGQGEIGQAKIYDVSFTRDFADLDTAFESMGIALYFPEMAWHFSRMSSNDGELSPYIIPESSIS
jgi:hypothetical protein